MPAVRDSPRRGKPHQAEQPASHFLLVLPPQAPGIRQRGWGHGQSFLSQGFAALKPAAHVSARQWVRNTEANANKNRPEGTSFYRKCQKTEMYVVRELWRGRVAIHRQAQELEMFGSQSRLWKYAGQHQKKN